MKRFLIPILALAVLVGLVKATLAAADQIYIFNQLFTGRSHKDSGTTWVSLDDFVKAAHIPPSAVIHTPPENGQTTVSYNGKRFAVPVDARATDTVYVDGQRLAEGMGGRWTFNSSLGLTDVYVPGPKAYRPTVASPGDATAPSPNPAANPQADAKPSGAPSAAPSSAASGAPDKSPLRISKFEFVNPTLPNNFINTLIRGTVEVKNTAPAEDYVDGVVITVHIQDGYENDLAKVTKEIGKIEGGKITTWDWEWNNGSALDVHPVVEVTHNIYLTKADRDKLAKDKQNPPDKKVSIRSGPTAGVPAAGVPADVNKPANQVTGSNGGLNPELPTPTVSTFVAPSSSPAPPGMNLGDTPTATDTATTAPSGPPGY